MTVRITLEFDSYAEALDAIGSLANIPNDQAGKGKTKTFKQSGRQAGKTAKKSGNGKSKPAPQAVAETPQAPAAPPPSPVSEAQPAVVGPDVSDQAFASWLNQQNTPDNTQTLVQLLNSYGVNRGSELTPDQRREFIAKWTSR